MQDQTSEAALNIVSEVSSAIAKQRIAIGILQGFLLYFLYNAGKVGSWPSHVDSIFTPLIVLGIFLPVLAMLMLGHFPAKKLWRWLGIYGAIIIAVSVHDAMRRNGLHNEWGNGPEASATSKVIFPSMILSVYCTIGLFISHSLLQASHLENKRFASYSSYFEAAWKMLVQMKFSALFVGVLWLVLTLGAELFLLIKLGFLQNLLREAWFYIPVTVFGFSCALHITDVRPGIVRGIRSLLLVLLSWLLPLALLISSGFLLSILGTGLETLWATKHATALLLGTCAVLIVLINAAFQDGDAKQHISKVLRISARLAALELLPLVSIAIYALYLRVGEYGWTSDRIIAAACLLVASAYAVGYTYAALILSNWLSRIKQVNVATAYLVLFVLFCLFTPIADPARISVSNQMARLQQGITPPEKFDFTYLRFDGAKYGKQALEDLQNTQTGKDAKFLRDKASEALQFKGRWSGQHMQAKKIDIRKTLTVWPKDKQLPESFLQQEWLEGTSGSGLPCIDSGVGECDAYLLDLSHDGNPEIIILGREKNSSASVFMQGKDGKWTGFTHLANGLSGCASVREAMESGKIEAIRAPIDALKIGDQIVIVPQWDRERFQCAGEGKSENVQ